MKKRVIAVLCTAIMVSTTMGTQNVFAEANNNGAFNLTWEAAERIAGSAEFSGIYTEEAVQGQGIAYYVSNSGSDSNDGKSEDKPYKTVKKAMEVLKAGDTLYLREGTYAEQINVTKSGTKDNYITIKPYPGEEVILDYSNIKITTGININSQSYVTVEGLTIQNITETSGNSAVGILVAGTSSNINIKNCTLTKVKAKSTKGNANVILVAGNSTKAPVSNIRIEGNTIYNCVCGWSESLTVNGNSQYVDVINNRIDNVGNIGIDIAGSFGVCSNAALDQARYVYVAGNVVSNSNSPNARSAGIYADGSRDVWFNGNTVYNSQSGIEVAGESKGLPSGNILVSNNLLYNNSQVSMIFGAYEPNTGIVKNVEVYNNTVYHTGSDQVMEISIIDGLTIKNNIFYSTSNVKILDSGSFSTSQVKNLSFDNNVVYGLKSTGIYYNNKSYTLKDFSKLLNGENIEKDPMFISTGTDFSLSEDSPCIDKGDTEIEAGSIDILGNNRIVNGIDIGAFEFIKDEIVDDDTDNDDEIDNGTGNEEADDNTAYDDDNSADDGIVDDEITGDGTSGDGFDNGNNGSNSGEADKNEPAGEEKPESPAEEEEGIVVDDLIFTSPTNKLQDIVITKLQNKTYKIDLMLQVGRSSTDYNINFKMVDNKDLQIKTMKIKIDDADFRELTGAYETIVPQNSKGSDLSHKVTIILETDKEELSGTYKLPVNVQIEKLDN